jgi:negative regulator of sigma E activity
MTDGPMSYADDAAMERYVDALGSASGHVPDDNVDWEAFHIRLAARAELPLARLRHPHSIVQAEAPGPTRQMPLRVGTRWWEHAARWSRLTVSASVAASIALMIVVRTSPKETASSSLVAATVDQVDGARAAFESAVVGHSAGWTIDSALMPSAADLLIPLGTGGSSRSSR